MLRMINLYPLKLHKMNIKKPFSNQAHGRYIHIKCTGKAKPNHNTQNVCFTLAFDSNTETFVG